MQVVVGFSAKAGNYNDTLLQKNRSIAMDELLQTFTGDADSCVIPFSRSGNLILLRAKADTMDGNFILDTGAPGLVLNITYFRDYVAVSDNEEQAGIGGVVSDVKKTQIRNFVFNCVTTKQVPADLINLGHIENTRGIKIFGLIGLSLLSKFEIVIDYENNLLYLYRITKKYNDDRRCFLLKDTSTYSVVPIEIVNKKIVTRAVLGGKKLRLVIDTGAESNVLDSRLPNRIFENVEILRRIQLTGTGDKKIEALYGNLNNFSVGNRLTGTLPVIITNLEKTCLSDITCIDGILGFDFLSLHKIGFNFVTNRMYIWK